MEKWCDLHPWMTFFIIMSALNIVGHIVCRACDLF